MSTTALVGTWLSIANESIAEIMAISGFDFVTVDLEHSSIELTLTEKLIRSIEGAGSRPFVRVSYNNASQIARVMDMGAHGIIVPNINSKEDVLKAKAAMLYPPLGSRGVGLSRAQSYGQDFEKNYKWCNENSYFFIQIENIKALDHLDDIFSTPGIDAYMLGPYDLSASMGIPGQFENSEFKAAISKIQEVAKKYNLPAGYHQVDPDVEKLSDFMQEGYKLLVYSVDFRILEKNASNAVSAMKKGMQ